MRCNRYGLERHIPEEIAREIRQVCKFTCVLCDNALVEYHHFAPEYAHARVHDPSGITLLCGTHHDRVTRGHLSNLSVAEADAARRKLTEFRGGALLLELRRPALVALGPMIFEGDGDLLTVDNERVLGVSREDGDRLSLWCRFLDKRRREALVIERNVVTLRPENWDVVVEGPHIRVHAAQRDIVLEIRLWPPYGFHIQRLAMKTAEWTIDARLDRLSFTYGSNVSSWDLANTVIICGGPTTLFPNGGFESLGGVIFGGAYGDRYPTLAQQGKFKQIADETRYGTVFHVLPTTVGWRVVTSMGQEVACYTNEERALERARELAKRAVMGRVVWKRRDGRSEVWFAQEV